MKFHEIVLQTLINAGTFFTSLVYLAAQKGKRRKHQQTLTFQNTENTTEITTKPEKHRQSCTKVQRKRNSQRKAPQPTWE